MIRASQALLLLTILGGCAGFGGGGGMSPGRGGTGAEAVQVAEAAYQSGDYEQAAMLFERASKDDLDSVPALIGLGRSYIALGQFIRAENALTRAHDIAPRNTRALTELGFLALNQKQPRRAVEFYDQALRTDRRSLVALTGKAVALDFLSRHGEAQEVYRAALKWYPTDFALLSNHALSLVLSGQIGEGIRLLEELLNDRPRGGAVRQNLALAYVLDGRDTDARAILAGVMPEAELGDTLAYYRKVRVDYRAGKPIGYLVFN